MRHCFAGEIKTFLVPDPATYTRLKEVINGIFRGDFLVDFFGVEKNQFPGTKPQWVMTLYR